MKILVVDDNKTLSTMLAQYLGTTFQTTIKKNDTDNRS